jgi:hypothetical protein
MIGRRGVAFCVAACGTVGMGHCEEAGVTVWGLGILEGEGICCRVLWMRYTG